MSPVHPADAGSTDNARLAMIERELGDFSYIVSHDLAAVFRHVSQFSLLLVQGLDHVLSDDQRVFADQIRSETAKCAAMMEQLLLYSRIQQKPLALRPVNAKSCADMAVLQLSGEIERTQANVTVGPLGMVNADPELMLLLFRHLLANALKFRRPGATPLVRVEQLSRDGQWAIAIADNGIGVPVETQEKLFRMFARLNPDRGREGEDNGVGAGLAICRRIARRLDGDVRFIACETGACVEVSLQNTVDARVHQQAAI